MAKNKLTPAQQKMLERLATGEFIHWMSGMYASGFWAGKYGNANSGTIGALKKRGLIEYYDNDWRGGKYRITPAGREAIE